MVALPICRIFAGLAKGGRGDIGQYLSDQSEGCFTAIRGYFASNLQHV